MSEPNENFGNGAMGRLAVLIAEVRSLRNEATTLTAAAQNLDAGLRAVYGLQVQTLNFLQELVAQLTSRGEGEEQTAETDSGTGEAEPALKSAEIEPPAKSDEVAQ